MKTKLRSVLVKISANSGGGSRKKLGGLKLELVMLNCHTQHAKHAFARGVWGHAPPRKILKSTCSEITSESILCQLYGCFCLCLMCIKQEYIQDHFHTIIASFSYIIYIASYALN